MTEVPPLVKFRTIRVQNLLSEVISYSFGIRFGLKTQEHVKTSTKLCPDVENDIFVKMHLNKGVSSWRVSLEGFPASFLTKSADQLILLFHSIKLIN